MLEPEPSVAKYPHQAFALTPADADEARRIAHLHLTDLEAARRELTLWFERAAPPPPDLRTTPLDPRLGRVIERLRAVTQSESAYADDVARAIAAWDGRAREVNAVAENTVMNAALRTERLLELDAPAIILEGDLRALEAALPRLDTPVAPSHPNPPDDSYEVLRLLDGIFRSARYDLSLGLHSQTLRVLEDEAEADFGADPVGDLMGGEPLVPFALLSARAEEASVGERITFDHLRFFRDGPDALRLAEVAEELADRLAGTTAAVRARVTEQLDDDVHRDLLGGDYVASAEARLRRMALDARAASKEGLQILSERSRNIAY